MAPEETAPNQEAPKRRGRPSKKQQEQARQEQHDFLVGCTVGERAYCVRLVSLLRENYWLTDFVRQLLDQEAKCTWNWSIKRAKDLLDNFESLDNLADFALNLDADWSNHPVLRAVRGEWGSDGEIAEYKSSKRVQRLIESAHRK